MMSSVSLVQMETDEKNDTSSKWFDLIPNRSLLDPTFEGYKLSLDNFVQYKLELNDNIKLDTFNFIESVESKQKFLLYQHLKLFGMQNLLHVNKYDDTNIYYFDENNCLIRIVYNLPKLVPQRVIVPTNLIVNNLNNNERTYITMKFVNETTTIIFDGYDTLYVYELDSQSRLETNPLIAQNWNLLFKYKLNENETTCVLKDAILYENVYHVLLLNVVETNDKTNNINKFDTIVNWLSFENMCLKRCRKLNCFTSVPEYISLETNGKSVYLAGPSYSKYIYDSEIKINDLVDLTKKSSMSKMDTDNGNGQNFSEKFYTWSQTSDEIIVKVKLDSHTKQSGQRVNKNDLIVNLRNDSIEIAYLNRIVLSGHFYSLIKLDESVWLLNNLDNSDQIELTLTKLKCGDVWPFFMKDQDKFGEYKVDEELNFCNEITSDTLAKVNESKSLFALEQQLEECDGMLDDQTNANIENDDMYLMLRRLDGDTHQTTHKCYINDNKFLFEVNLNKNKSNALCLRHDVDGIIWQPHRVSTPASVDTIWLTHEHTFLAFGYVQASKQDTKFKSCSPDCSYVAIVDTKRHVYVYKQDSGKLDTQLKNRKTGKLITQVAKQYLISFDFDSEVYGLYCSNDFMIVLFKNSCHIFKINSNSN